MSSCKTKLFGSITSLLSASIRLNYQYNSKTLFVSAWKIIMNKNQRMRPMKSEHAEDLDNYYKWRNGCIVKLIAYPIILGIIVMIIYASILLSKEKHIQWTKEAINQQKQKEIAK